MELKDPFWVNITLEILFAQIDFYYGPAGPERHIHLYTFVYWGNNSILVAFRLAMHIKKFHLCRNIYDNAKLFRRES